MTNSIIEDLNILQDISNEISDLINKNNYEQILELDLQRRKIIQNITNSKKYELNDRFMKDNLYLINGQNTKLVKVVEDKMTELKSNHRKFSKRLTAYSASK